MKKLRKFTKIKISISYLMIWAMFSVLFFHRFFIQLGVPDAIKYLLDILNVLLFIYALGKKITLKNTEKKYLLCFGIMLAIGSFSFLINATTWGGDFLYYFFDCRAVVRFVIFFISCKTLLNEQTINKLFDWVLAFHLLNSIYIVYQYFTLEVDTFWMRGDNLNGFFGTATGGNTYVNTLMIAVYMIILYRWIKKQCPLKIMLFFSGINLIIATLIELKAYYIEFIIISAYFALPYVKKITIKQLILGGGAFCCCVVTIAVLIRWLYKIYPWMIGTLTSISGFISTSSSDNSIGNIGRITFFRDVFTRIFHKNIADMIMGVGLGTANTNGAMTKFANIYDHTHYSWLSSSYILVETGIIGLILYLYSFVLLFLNNHRSLMSEISKASCIIAVFLIIYNETFRTEAGYIMFFLLSLSYIDAEKKENTYEA